MRQVDYRDSEVAIVSVVGRTASKDEFARALLIDKMCNNMHVESSCVCIEHVYVLGKLELDLSRKGAKLSTTECFKGDDENDRNCDYDNDGDAHSEHGNDDNENGSCLEW